MKNPILKPIVKNPILAPEIHQKPHICISRDLIVLGGNSKAQFKPHVEEWRAENAPSIEGPYLGFVVGWYVIYDNDRDAVLFRMRWC